MNILSIESKQNTKDYFLYLPSRDELSYFKSDSFKRSSFVEKDINDFHLYILLEYPFSGAEVSRFVQELSQYLTAKMVRWVYVIGNREGSTIGQALSIQHKKLVRRLMLINPHTRKSTDRSNIILDYLEKIIPCGLPLRKLANDFDARSHIHQVHTPTLVLLSKTSNSYEVEQVDFLSKRIPNCWVGEFFSEKSSDMSLSLNALLKIAQEFKEVPIKAPQKNIENSR
jgi:pimeloyl-ACP methyl ester carboxylesterase